MTQRQQALIAELIHSLPEGEKKIHEKVVNCLVELGYVPQKNRSYLSFKHKLNGKVIAKIRKGELRIKFFACKNPSEKVVDALRREMEANGGQYSLSVPPPDCDPMPSGVMMKKCTLQCNVCTGGGMRYYYQFPEGKEVFRCGAYPVLIPDIEESDIDELKRLILEQHNYFLAIA